MEQPDLGKKILELRLAKGFTQEELAEKCNVNLRTIQRIESAQVNPRSYTIKLIFENLGENIYKNENNKTFNGYKNAFIVATVLIFSFILYTLLNKEGKNKNYKSVNHVKLEIQKANSKIIDWYKNNQIDSIGTLFIKEATYIAPKGYQYSGREWIVDQQRQIYSKGSRIENLEIQELIVSDSIVFERGLLTRKTWHYAKDMIVKDSLALALGLIKEDSKMSTVGVYMCQWKLEKGEWLIQNRIESY